MYIHLPWFGWLPVVGGSLLAAGFFVAALARAGRAARLGASGRRTVVAGVVLFLAAWFASYVYAAAHGAFTAAAGFPTLPIALLLPLLVAFIALKAFPALRTAVDNVPQEQLIGIQGIRLMGFAFLLLLVQTQLPAVFALPAGFGDMLVGVEAIFVARLFARRAASAPAMGLLLGATGIADFVVALTIGFLASSTPLRLIHVTPSTDLVTVLPLVMVPAFGVPLFIVLHGLSIGRILSRDAIRSRSAAAPAA
jgi:hypothetical protein